MACPGLYCGRTLFEDGARSGCGPCPRGFRRNDTTFLCAPCTDDPSFYDWLYLGFMVLLVLILHWFFIDMVSMRRSFSKDIIVLHTTALFEVLVSSFLSLILVQPLGRLYINSCRPRRIADWYTLLHNPTPNYEKTIHCSNEAVYPLYSIVFLFLAFSLVIMLLVRPWVCRKYLPRQSKMSIYAAMYFIPILVLMHALVGGILYYSFPYLVVIISVISNAAHFAVKMNQSIGSLIKTTFTEPRNMIILLGHWCLHAYGIVSITQLANPMMHSLLILLVPMPALFYILTVKFTDPSANF